MVGEDYEQALAASEPTADGDSGPGPELMFYTSGTTARPKGVVHGALADAAGRHAGMEGQVALWSWTPDDVYVMSGPAYHASHCGWALCALYIGATTVITERFEARSWLEEVSRHRGTRSFMVPAHFIRILELPDEERAAIDTSSLSLVVHAAAPCPDRRQAADDGGLPPAPRSTSSTGRARVGPPASRPKNGGPIPAASGVRGPASRSASSTRTGAPLPTGESGLVYIRPPGGRRFSYRNDDAATAKAWRDDAFTVGDIGFLDEEGYLTITDRASDMVLWGGVNIAPREIEEVLYEHPDVVDCAVFGIPDERDGEHLKAIVQLRRPVETSELEAHVRARLASYKVPHVWEVTDELPRDQNGKVLKRLLRAAHAG